MTRAVSSRTAFRSNTVRLSTVRSPPPTTQNRRARRPRRQVRCRPPASSTSPDGACTLKQTLWRTTPTKGVSAKVRPVTTNMSPGERSRIERRMRAQSRRRARVAEELRPAEPSGGSNPIVGSVRAESPSRSCVATDRPGRGQGWIQHPAARSRRGSFSGRTPTTRSVTASSCTWSTRTLRRSCMGCRAPTSC